MTIPEELDALEALASRMDEPEGDGSIIGRAFIVATILSRGVTALISEVRLLRDALAAADAAWLAKTNQPASPHPLLSPTRKLGEPA